MKQLKVKSILWGLFILAGLQFAACKSKPKTDSANTTDTSITVPPPEAPVEISPDESLQAGVRDATKDHPGVNATVSNGEITLTGTITRDKLPSLMQAINSLHPKKINNNLTIK